MVDLTDEQIAAMQPDQRRQLIWRLARPGDELLPPRATLRRIRYVRLAVTTSAAVLLVPWIAYLAVALPDRYVVHRWSATWVGFDVLLLCLLATTAVLGWLRRQLVVLTSFATGVLLLCDAWFDIMTANRHDLWLSLAAAAFEIPLGMLLLGGALRLTRYLAARLWILRPGMRLWEVPLLLPGPPKNLIMYPVRLTGYGRGAAGPPGRQG